ERFTTIEPFSADIFYYNNDYHGCSGHRLYTFNPSDENSPLLVCDHYPLAFTSFIPVSIDCDSTAIFAITVSGDIYLYDLETCFTTLYCTSPFGDDENIAGLSSLTMFMPPSGCEISVDLDISNNSAPGIHSIT